MIYLKMNYFKLIVLNLFLIRSFSLNKTSYETLDALIQVHNDLVY